MKVKVIKAFRAHGELMPVGTVLNIRDEDFTKLIGKVEPLNLDQLEQEYSCLIRRFWSLDDDPTATMDEARRLVVWIDQIYRQLQRAGRRVPVRLPVERNQAHVQKELAL